MNIELQCCGLAMLTVLILIFLREKSLDYTSRRKYLFAIISCIVCLSLDVVSIIGIHFAYQGIISPWLARLICKLYVLSLALQAYEGFQYAASEVFSANSHKKLKLFYLIFFLLGGVAIMALPINYFEDGRLVYSEGPSTLATYAVVLPFLISSIVMAFMGGDRTSSVRKWSILIWQGVWIIAALLQLVFQGLLLVGFAAAFGMVLIYAELENPHEGIDRTTGQFTANAFIAYVSDRIATGRPFASNTYRILYTNKNVDFESNRVVLIKIANVLSQDKNVLVFRNSDSSFTAIYKNEEHTKREYDRVIRAVNEIGIENTKLSVINIDSSAMFNSSDEFFRFLHYYENEHFSEEFIKTDESVVAKMRKYFDTIDMINSALTGKRIKVFYQPIYNNREKRFSSAEALVRIIGEDGRIIAPAEFIPVAEQSGLIVAIGEEVFRQVCEFLKNSEAKGLGLEYVEVNLSAVQFDGENPAKFVKQIIGEYGVDPKWINLEITETAVNNARPILLKNMTALVEEGVTFSLDDFGTGRSNLDYFVDMPVKIVKFDFKFTHSYFESEKARHIIEGVVSIIDKLGLDAVAEGVETKEQLDTMSKLGITYIQGFYFSKPLPENEFIGFLRANNDFGK